MKRSLMLSLLCLCTTLSQAQTFEEWFRQKKTQKQYLLKQIAALQIYIEFLGKSYRVAKDGLDLIGDIKDKEFSLHKDYFNSLNRINPAIRNCSKADKILQLKKAIGETCASSLRQIKASDMFSQDEIFYINRVYERLLTDCEQISSQLTELTDSHILQMTDAQRLSRIDDLYLQVQEQYSFLKEFSNQALGLALNRTNEQDQIHTNQKLQGASGQ